MALGASNTLAGRLSDVSLRRGWGNVGCFLGGAAACVLAMLALEVFSLFGDLGRDDLLHAAQPAAA